jgi:hypothetical protein
MSAKRAESYANEAQQARGQKCTMRIHDPNARITAPQNKFLLRLSWGEFLTGGTADEMRH